MLSWIKKPLLSVLRDGSKTSELEKQLAIYRKENERLVNESKNFRHNTLNILHTANSYIEFEDWDGLKKYFRDTLDRIKNITDATVSAVEKIGNPSLKKLLLSRLESSIGSGIDIKVMIDENILIESNLISEIDLCIVIGEFLDNAIKAALTASHKRVSIYMINNENSISIIIESTFKEQPNVSLIKTGSVTTKDIGLIEQSANTILSKYTNILNNVFIQHQVFVQELQIIR